MDQAKTAKLAKRAALRTVQSDIGDCAPCAASMSLSGFSGNLGCDCEKTGIAKCSACKSRMSSWSKEFGDFTSSISDSLSSALPWIIVTALVVGFISWKFGNFYAGTKYYIKGAVGRAKGAVTGAASRTKSAISGAASSARKAVGAKKKRKRRK